MDRVRWYVCKSKKFPGKWLLRKKDVLITFEDVYYINSKIQVKAVHAFDFLGNSPSFYFPTREAARAALQSYRKKWFGMYAKHWDKRILK